MCAMVLLSCLKNRYRFDLNNPDQCPAPPQQLRPTATLLLLHSCWKAAWSPRLGQPFHEVYISNLSYLAYIIG